MTIQDTMVVGGISASPNIGRSGEFNASLGIDPDMPATTAGVRPSGVIRPTQVAKFSGTEITGVPLWMISNSKDTNCYTYANDGKCHVVSSALAMGTALNSGNALTTSSGNGAAYFDNYIYFTTNTDITRYGPLNGSPVLTQDFWTGNSASPLKINKTALVDTTYPSINGVEMPNHVMHRHTDDKLYFGDVVGNSGYIHYIKTKKTTVEGDTDDSSTYQKLDLGYGIYPTCIESYGTYLLIGAIEGVSTAVNQKSAKLILWDTVSATFDDITPDNFADPLITAIKNANGTIYIFSGSALKGCRITRFAGVGVTEPIAYIADAYPPLAGAVDHYLTRVAFGTSCTKPAVGACVYAFGSTYPEFGKGLHNILKSSSAGANPWVTCLRYFAQSATSPQPIIGYDDDTNKGIDALATASNTSITVKIYFDDEAVNQTVATINNANNGSEKDIVIKPTGARGEHNFYMELTWSNGAVWQSEVKRIGLPFTIDRIRIPLTAAIGATFVGTVNLPITYEITTEDY